MNAAGIAVYGVLKALPNLVIQAVHSLASYLILCMSTAALIVSIAGGIDGKRAACSWATVPDENMPPSSLTVSQAQAGLKLNIALP